MRYLHFIALLFASHFGLAGGEDSTTPPQLLGIWDVVAMQDHGRDVKLEEVSIRFEFTNSRLILRVSENGHVNDGKPSHVYDLRVHGDGQVRNLDLTSADNSPGPEAGIKLHGIFRIEGNKLRVCYADELDHAGRASRPDKFESTAEAKTHLYTLTRVNPR